MVVVANSRWTLIIVLGHRSRSTPHFLRDLHNKAFRSISKRHSSLDRSPSSPYGASYEPLHSCFDFGAAIRLPL
jgi:hypothetical protein